MDVSGACTNRIEGEWGVVKSKIKSMRGLVNVDCLYYLLARHQWLRWEAEEYPGGPYCCMLSKLRIKI